MPNQLTSEEIINTEKAIVRKIAELPADTEIVFNDSGWDSRVYSFHEASYFVKFPRSAKIRARYRTEIEALKLAATIDSGVAVPLLQWEHPEFDYFGYRGVPGRALEDVISTLDTDEKQRVGSSIGDFLKQFHQKKVSGARDMSIKEEIRQLQNWYEKAEPAILDIFTVADQKRLHKRVMEQIPKALNELGSQPMLCHGDLAAWNIIYSDTGNIGIIDFGDICYCDGSKDLLDFGDQVILESAIQAYGDTALLRSKIAARVLVPEIITLGFYSLKGNQQGVAQTAAKIRTAL